MQEPVKHVSAWHASSAEKDYFVVELQSSHLQAFDNALSQVRNRELETEQIGCQDFPLDSIATDVKAWVDEVVSGKGLLILRGFPVGDVSREDIETIYFGLGTHFGTAMSQSVMGDRLGHVINVGGRDPKERAYRNSMELDMHTDACDIVAMLSLQKAVKGGYSGYVSGISVYNEVLNRAPVLMRTLMRGFYYHRFGEEAPGESPVTEERVPVFSFEDNYLSINYLRSYIEMAAEEMGEPLTDQEIAALDLVDDIAHDDQFALKFITEPGEAVFFNNLTVLHNRTAFDDSEDPALRRHLLRLWLVAHNPRPVSSVLRIYEGRGIDPQEGRNTYFDRDIPFKRLAEEDGRM